MTRSEQAFRRRLGLAALALGALACAQGAHGQAIERNLPPKVEHGASPILTPVAPGDTDATPLGPALRGVAVLGPDAPVRADPQAGLDLGGAPRLRSGARRRLARLIGRPLSRRLIAQIEAEVVRSYRAAGYPLVSVSTPEQEVSSGVLQLRVVEFRLGERSAPGARDPAYVLSRVRAAPGAAVAVGPLEQDLDWLNRAPFRTVAAAFKPGQAPGTTDLVLQTTYAKPWSVNGGYADSGSPLTGFDRYFFGATVPLPFLPDASASYQFTGSNDLLFNQDRLFASSETPHYLSHAVRVVVPTLPRQAVEASASYVESYEVTDFVAHQVTDEASLDYRSALSNLWAPLTGEGFLGVEARRSAGGTLFAGEPIQRGVIDVFQVFLGYSGAHADRLGRTAWDATLHLSPGGVGADNTDAAFAQASQGRSRSAEYGYLSGDLQRSTRLPGGWSYGLSLVGQYAPNPLPLTEQVGLGGPSLVRGYTLDDGVFDSGVVARNELRTPSLPLLQRLSARWADRLSPYAFLDAAWGRNAYTRTDSSPVGAGLGADYQFGAHLSAGLACGIALKPEGQTHSGQARLDSRVTLSF